MKRFELLRDAKTAEQVIKPICDALAESDEYLCERCPFSERCHSNRNGLLYYLTEEVPE